MSINKQLGVVAAVAVVGAAGLFFGLSAPGPEIAQSTLASVAEPAQAKGDLAAPATTAVRAPAVRAPASPVGTAPTTDSVKTHIAPKIIAPGLAPVKARQPVRIERQARALAAATTPAVEAPIGDDDRAEEVVVARAIHSESARAAALEARLEALEGQLQHIQETAAAEAQKPKVGVLLSDAEIAANSITPPSDFPTPDPTSVARTTPDTDGIFFDVNPTAPVAADPIPALRNPTAPSLQLPSELPEDCETCAPPEQGN